MGGGERERERENTGKETDIHVCIHKRTYIHRYIEVFRSSHVEVRPVKSTPRSSPYARPGARGGFSGYGGYGGKYGSGYERGYNRGRGRGPPPGHFHPPYDAPYGGKQKYMYIRSLCNINVN